MEAEETSTLAMLWVAQTTAPPHGLHWGRVIGMRGVALDDIITDRFKKQTLVRTHSLFGHKFCFTFCAFAVVSFSPTDYIVNRSLAYWPSSAALLRYYSFSFVRSLLRSFLVPKMVSPPSQSFPLASFPRGLDRVQRSFQGREVTFLSRNDLRWHVTR